MIFNKSWIWKQLKRDPLLRINTNAKNWVHLKDQQFSEYKLGRKVRDKFHLNNIALNTDIQQKRLQIYYYAKGDHALLYHQYLVANG